MDFYIQIVILKLKIVEKYFSSTSFLKNCFNSTLSTSDRYSLSSFSFSQEMKTEINVIIITLTNKIDLICLIMFLNLFNITYFYY